ncbi:MAG: hypothetical protein NTW11_00955 [Candidatus Staskawiczbacteria bacterium]|nr:hypothetical protein [Candidatus Staskawiczbacteria bacterium]
MNFGITKIKGMATLIISVIGGIILSSSAGWWMCFDCSSDIATQSLITGIIVGFFCFFIPIYIIWSFFDIKQSSRVGKIIGIILTIVFILIVLSLIGLFMIEKVYYPNIH